MDFSFRLVVGEINSLHEINLLLYRPHGSARNVVTNTIYVYILQLIQTITLSQFLTAPF